MDTRPGAGSRLWVTPVSASTSPAGAVSPERPASLASGSGVAVGALSSRRPSSRAPGPPELRPLGAEQDQYETGLN